MSVVVRLLWCVLVLGASVASCQPRIPALTDTEKARMDTLTRDMTTRCFGRYLIDLPVAFTAGYQDSHTLPPGVKDISIKRMSKPEFDLDIAAYEKMLRTTGLYDLPRNEPGTVLFQSVENTPSIEHGKVFNRIEDAGSLDMLRNLDLWAWKDGYSIRMKLTAYDGRAAKYKGDEFRSQYNTPQKLQQLLELYSRTRGRADDEIPTEAGFCIRNGFVAGKAVEDVAERLNIKYNLTGTPDVYVILESTSEYAEDDTLLERSESDASALSGSGIRKLRSGVVKGVTGLMGEEFLGEGPVHTKGADGKPLIGHGFFYEAHSKIATAQQPLLMVTLYTAEPQMHPKKPKKDLYDISGDTKIGKAGLSRAEAVALWDAIIRTIRPRPGAF